VPRFPGVAGAVRGVLGHCPPSYDLALLFPLSYLAMVPLRGGLLPARFQALDLHRGLLAPADPPL